MQTKIPVPEIEIKVVQNEERLPALEPAWNSLVESMPTANVFLRHEWFDAAWQWCRQEADLRVLSVWRGDTLIGLCPFMLRRERRYGMALRVLQFLSIPDTQYCEPIVAAHEAAAVGHALKNWLTEQSRDWDVFELRYLPEDSPTARAVLGTCELPGTESIFEPNYYIGLKESWKAFYQRRSRRLKKSNNLVANRLRRAGEIEVEWVRDPARAGEALAAAIRLSSASWKHEKPIRLDNPGPNGFVQRLTEHARRMGWLSIWILRLDGVPIAYEYQLAYQDKIYALRADYDAARAALSPGTYLNWKVTEGLFESPFTRYYLGPGANEYKLRWTRDAERMERKTVYGQSPRARTFRLLKQRVIPIARRIRAWSKRRETESSA